MRVTAVEVLTIMGLTIDNYSEEIINSYILAANRMVDDNLIGKGLSSDTLKEIERWISAHLLSVSQERQAQKEGAGGAYIEYTGTFGEGLQMTSYGQVAISLDNTGTLQALTKGKARIFAIPTKYD